MEVKDGDDFVITLVMFIILIMLVYIVPTERQIKEVVEDVVTHHIESCKSHESSSE